MGARSLFMKRGSGSTPVVVVPSAARAEQSQSQQTQQQQQQQHYGTIVAAAENEEELMLAEHSLYIASQRRNPIAKALGSSIGLLASVGLFIYGFGMVFGNREAILERWRMASSP